MKEFIKQLLSSTGMYSSKRFVAILTSLSLVISMFIYNSDILVSSVLTVCLTALGSTAVVSILKKDNKKEDEQDN